MSSVEVRQPNKGWGSNLSYFNISSHRGSFIFCSDRVSKEKTIVLLVHFIHTPGFRQKVAMPPRLIGEIIYYKGNMRQETKKGLPGSVREQEGTLGTSLV